jgi:hypothetical protein
MLVHHRSIGSGNDDRGADLTICADCAKYIDRIVAIIPYRGTTSLSSIFTAQLAQLDRRSGKWVISIALPMP